MQAVSSASALRPARAARVATQLWFQAARRPPRAVVSRTSSGASPSRLFCSTANRLGNSENGIRGSWLTRLGGGAALLLAIATWQAQAQAIHLEAALPATAQLPSESYDDFRTDPATGTPLPVILSPKPAALEGTDAGQLRLVGLGVRTVSFLRVRVYVAALYVDERAWSKASGVLAPNADALDEEQMRTLLDAGVPCVIRIVPVRSTDYHHLRDGFTRSVQARLKTLRKADTQQQRLTPELEEHLSGAITHLKSIFPKQSLPKGSALDLVFAPADPQARGRGPALSLEADGTLLGRVDAPPAHLIAGKAAPPSVASELFLAYFANKDPISAPFKDSVAQGVEAILKARARS